MPFDMKKLLAESIYERCNAYEEILPQLLKTTSENLIAHSTQMKDSLKKIEFNLGNFNNKIIERKNKPMTPDDYD